MAEPLRVRVTIRGAVQGVGFRPFVYRLATGLGLNGWVNNSAQGVFLEVEGPPERVQNFLLCLEQDKPARAFIQSLEASFLDPAGYTAFEIRASEVGGVKRALVLPDLATCPECVREIFTPGNRRYQYPFTNCTNCGPRFSIIAALPYDRPNTTMKRFTMCPQCQAEYDDPQDRRFHAQPNACPVCGPHLELWQNSGRVVAAHHPALLAAAEALRQGAIVAIKGLGGFHLMVEARNEAAVRELRRRKHREEKPLALMYPTLSAVHADCEVSAMEERLLLSPESPIVLLQRRRGPLPSGPAFSVAPDNPWLGVMLPYTPLHHLLMAELGFPVVATSANLSDEPICIDEQEALQRLPEIADLFLVHDRPILRHMDDSIVRVLMERELVLRRARGYAPLPVMLAPSRAAARPQLAVGAHLKNTVAIARDREVFLSQHLGDLETDLAGAAFRETIVSLQQLFELQPAAVACDTHPDYLSTQYAEQRGLPVQRVQHHYAHVLACMAENELDSPVLGVSWDGTGLGPDGTVWGGEFLRVNRFSFERIAHFRLFPLPGGDKAMKEPRRTAVGLLYELFGEPVFDRVDLASLQSFAREELPILRRMCQNQVHSPWTSSAGRLFDAVASLTGLCQRVRFEGQAAMMLEFSLEGHATAEAYPLRLWECGLPHRAGGTAAPSAELLRSAMVVDWAPMFQEILQELRTGVPAGVISAKFHNALIEAIVVVAQRVAEQRVVLTGGCFQNKYLTEGAVRRLRHEGFRPYWHQRVPPNDGGIALGQVVAATA